MSELRNRQVLLIADETPSVDALRAALIGSGYAITQAAQPADALRRTAHRCPDLIIIFAELSGLEACRLCAELRNQCSFMEVPILLLSARPQPIRQVRQQAYGADAWLATSATPAQVLPVITRLLDEPSVC